MKGVIYLIGLAVLGICVIIGGVSISGNAGVYLPVLLVLLLTAVPFFFGLYQGLLLLNYIERNIAFSSHSVKAIQNIKYCAFAVSTLYAAAMPLIIYAAQKDDAPGAVAIGLIICFAFLVTGVFAAVLQKLLENGMEIKSENELTI